MLFLCCFSQTGSAGRAGQLTDGAGHDSGREIGYVYKTERVLSDLPAWSNALRQRAERPAGGREGLGRWEALFLSVYPLGLAAWPGGPFCSRPLHHFHFFSSRSVSSAYSPTSPPPQQVVSHFLGLSAVHITRRDALSLSTGCSSKCTHERGSMKEGKKANLESRSKF